MASYPRSLLLQIDHSSSGFCEPQFHYFTETITISCCICPLKSHPSSPFMEHLISDSCHLSVPLLSAVSPTSLPLNLFSWFCRQRGSSQILSFDLLRVLQTGPLTCKVRYELTIRTNKTFSDLTLKVPQLLPLRPPLPSTLTKISQSNSFSCPYIWPTQHSGHTSDTVNTHRARVLALHLMTNITP